MHFEVLSILFGKKKKKFYIHVEKYQGHVWNIKKCQVSAATVIWFINDYDKFLDILSLVIILVIPKIDSF